MALDDEARTGRDGKPLPLDMREGTLLAHHGLGRPGKPGLVGFVRYTTEVASPREGGAVVEFEFLGDGFLGGCTDTAVAGELTLPLPDQVVRQPVNQ